MKTAPAAWRQAGAACRFVAPSTAGRTLAHAHRTGLATGETGRVTTGAAGACDHHRFRLRDAVQGSADVRPPPRRCQAATDWPEELMHRRSWRGGLKSTSGSNERPPVPVPVRTTYPAARMRSTHAGSAGGEASFAIRELRDKGPLRHELLSGSTMSNPSDHVNHSVRFRPEEASGGTTACNRAVIRPNPAGRPSRKPCAGHTLRAAEASVDLR